MSRYKGGRDDDKDAGFGASRNKTTVEPVLGSSKNLGHSDDGRKSHEAIQEEKEYRSGRGSTLGSESSSSRTHHRQEESRNQSGGNSATQSSNLSGLRRGNGKYERGYGDNERKRSSSPDGRRTALDRDDSHKGARNNAGRNSDTSRYDRDQKQSRSRSPDKRRDRKRSRSRSHERRRSRSRSRERRRSRSRDKEREKKRGRSRSREKRSRSQSRDRRRSRSKDRRFRRSRSTDRLRARSRSRTPSYCRPRPPVPPVDKVAVKVDDTKKAIEVEKKPVELSHEKPSNLPLNDLSQLPKPGMMTPQMAVQQAMAAMNAKAQQLTGVTLPKYYNPAAVNPLKYAEQMQKRKLLWQSTQKKVVPAPSTNNWEQTTFAQDNDGKMAAKFKKLMGIKKELEERAPLTAAEEQLRKQEELFRTLDQQYETARMSTHSYRGVGLGFSSNTSATLTSQMIFPK